MVPTLLHQDFIRAAQDERRAALVRRSGADARRTPVGLVQLRSRRPGLMARVRRAFRPRAARA